MKKRQRREGVVKAAVLAAVLAGACVNPGAAAIPTATGTEVAQGGERTGEVVTGFDDGLAEGWQDYGWAAVLAPGGPAVIDLSGWGGLILAKPGLGLRHADVELVMDLPDDVDSTGLLRVSVGNGGDEFPTVVPVFARAGQRWTATLDGAALNPSGRAVDRVVIAANVDLPPGTTVSLHALRFLLRTAPVPAATAEGVAAVAAQCGGPGTHPISPYIYGVAFSPRREGEEPGPWPLGPSIRRWGGNPTSRYNWQDGHAWNTAADYFWRNVTILPGDEPAWSAFLDANAARGVASAVTVPTIGWVARDRTSYSFPVTSFGDQEQTDPDIPDAGNGNSPNGDPIDAGPPETTSIVASPAFVGAWVAAMEASGAPPVQLILDNEPDLWHDTHRDVHPEPATYDEIWRRTVDYGTAVRNAAPRSTIAGPSSWGWWGYFYSAADHEAGFGSRPDRRAHGDTPFLAWYLDQVAAHEQRTGVRLVDLLDVHFYPQGPNVYSADGEGGSDPETARLRVRSTRALWDPSYTDESWIDEPVMLLPRMQQLVAEHAPGVGLSIGEYSFGGESQPSGAVAQAEALGRFAQFGVDSAFYWTYPEPDSAVGAAFRAFRNFDGDGGRFLDTWVPSVGTDTVSLFTSTDGREVVAVVVNLDDHTRQSVTATFEGCGALSTAEAFRYDGSTPELTPVNVFPQGQTLELDLPPWSITTVRLTVTPPGAGS